jgi:hypothetical protein
MDSTRAGFNSPLSAFLGPLYFLKPRCQADTLGHLFVTEKPLYPNRLGFVGARTRTFL